MGGKGGDSVGMGLWTAPGVFMELAEVFPLRCALNGAFKWWILRNNSIEGFTLSSASEELFAPGRCPCPTVSVSIRGDTNCSMKCLRMGGEK